MQRVVHQKMNYKPGTLADTPYLPSTGSLKYKTFCSHFVTMVLRRSYFQTQCLPSLVKYGWEFSNSLSSFVICRNAFLGQREGMSKYQPLVF